MKKYVLEFLKRGLTASVGGPIILAIIYGVLGSAGTIETLSPNEVVLGVLTSALLAFVAAGITVVYHIERLPLFPAVLIHGAALYADYILIYLLNGWLQSQFIPIAIFTGVFIVGYAIIWLCIYMSIKAKTGMINSRLNAEQ